MRAIRLLIPLACASLAACSTPGGVAVGNPLAPAQVTPASLLAGLAKFSDADLKNAAADAKAHNDVIAEPCWTYLDGVVAGFTPAPGQPVTLGVASAIQLARDGVSIQPQFLLACGPLITDINMRLVGGGLAAAGAISTGGALSPIIGLVTHG
jgi:hypothetical protein